MPASVVRLADRRAKKRRTAPGTPLVVQRVKGWVVLMVADREWWFQPGQAESVAEDLLKAAEEARRG
jgi:hypothetical protein